MPEVNFGRAALSAFTVARHPHMTLQQRRHLTTLGFPLPPGNFDQVRVCHEGGDNGCEGGTSTEWRSKKVGEASGGCRALLPQRGPAGTAIGGRPHVSSNQGASEPLRCTCKGYEVDPSLCVCRVTSGPQHFFLGDFADGSDPEDLKFGLESRGSSEHGEKLRALRHLGSGGGSEDLRGPDESGSLRHLGSGGGGEDLQELDESGSLRHLGSGNDRGARGPGGLLDLWVDPQDGRLPD